MIDHATISKIIDASEIIDVIQDFVSLKKRGVNYLGLCPFHNEKTPSFTVSPVKGIYKCFGCGRGGNSVNFVMEHEHLTYPEALKYLAKKYHIEVVEKERTQEEIQQQNERESMLVVLSYAQKYFEETLFHNDEGISIGLTYFKERGFRQEILKKFGVGYSPEQRDAFTKNALSAGYKLDFLTKTGMSIARENYKFDRFHGRVIFPIHSLSGQVIGFGGRILKTDAKAAKYLNSPETEVYHKSRALYGIYQAKSSIVSNNKCYLVEGYTDVLSLHQVGIENVVASSGTALTPDQIRLIKRFTPFITIIFDGDEAGLKASLRGIDLILEEGLNVQIVVLPDGEDPDSYSKKLSTTEFIEFIDKNSKDFIKFKTELLVKDAEKDPVKKANLIKDIVKSISVIPDGITRSVYLKECSSLLNSDEKILYFEMNKIRRKSNEQKYRNSGYREQLPPPVTPVQQHAETEIYSDTEAQEREIIRLLLQYGQKELFEVMGEDEEAKYISVDEFIISELNIDELILENKLYQHILELYSSYLSKGISPDEKMFINHEEYEIRELSALLLAPTYNLSKIWKKHDNFIETEEMKLKEIIPETLYAFKNKKVIEATRELEINLKKAVNNNNLEEILAIQERIMNLNILKKELAKNLGDRTII
ncbi:MAG: DNA primase [Bacteroidales bacterium]|nr:DNA primase [Bacteroidales bacterium]